VRIAYLSAASAPDLNVDHFREGMRGIGYIEGRDFVIEVRYAQRDYTRFPALVEELLHAKVDLIVTGGPAAQAAPLASRSVPVVFGFSGNPVELGVVTAFARPGGNATGLSFLALDLAANGWMSRMHWLHRYNWHRPHGSTTHLSVASGYPRTTS
jgi:putative ABC transport system substrate-binding protein